ncbi:helix-turn-helix domain-containing protein [Providencia stuartii]|uniref:MerR family regulatory protein n=1 Tax=Providencia stuartii (strain MRSN 2154) TaxID=1157951 RepID=A0A140STE0_PROSM|nr:MULTISPECIES: helix-turn-helix domain-containing protein [Providencia]AFH95923.1 MerR family regulatory protein [Providencia stuartii MRSN 2154]MDE8744786.1 helix-turn-helix domain-containing protein [Providencia thailandensis]MDE8766005.1 helix-turn-helix domain-containing protein [Providencia thailandensis]MDE8778260.1 helix-turn-helix domain-containing protein [Providencia thailandensis]MDE8782516.1 helix-turn-helix domain-containing protein [Providencia thailandensis]
MVDELDISEVSELSCLPPSTLRYYEEKGLITPIGRKGLKRVYHGKDVMTRLSLIALGREAKFSLDEISTMLNQRNGPTIDRGYLITKAEEIQKVIDDLSALKKGILHIVNCPEENHLACPKFQKIMSIGLRNSRKFSQ